MSEFLWISLSTYGFLDTSSRVANYIGRQTPFKPAPSDFLCPAFFWRSLTCGSDYSAAKPFDKDLFTFLFRPLSRPQRQGGQLRNALRQTGVVLSFGGTQPIPQDTTTGM